MPIWFILLMSWLIKSRYSSAWALCILQFSLGELALGDVLDDAVNPCRVARRVPGELIGHDVDAEPRCRPGR